MLEPPRYKLEEGIFADGFHVFEIEWDEQHIAWLIDGKEYASTPISSSELSEFQEEFFILLNIAMGGTYAGYPDESSSFPHYMFFDWVRIYHKGKE